MSTVKQQYDRASWTILVSLIITIIILVSQLPPGGGLLGGISEKIHPIFNRLDLLLYDLRFNASLAIKKPSSPSSGHKILIVDVDEKSLQEVGRWPWSRKTIAELTQKMFDAGAIVITYDVVFSEPERNSVNELRSNLPKLPIDVNNYLKKVEGRFDNDRYLADLISGRDVILGFVFHENSVTTNLPPISHVKIEGSHQDLDVNKITAGHMQGITTNIPILQNAALAEGFLNAPPDKDGTVRRAPLVYRYQDGFYTSLALQTALAYNLVEYATVNTTPVGQKQFITTVSLGNSNIPTDKYGQMLVPYRGGRGYFPYISATDILANRIESDVFPGAIVLVGTSAIGLTDLRGTPVGIQYPGVEAQATVVDAILTGDIPYKPDWATGANIVGIVFLFVVLNILFPICGPFTSVLTGTFSLFAIMAGNFWLWHFRGIDLPSAGLIMQALVIFMCYLAYGFVFSSRQKHQIQNMFGQYVAPAHIDKLMNTPASLSFAGETKEMTVMFSDIRQFTSISEKLTANQLKDFLNGYLTPMTEIIFSQQGTIDKYVGDMIMAFWGAPLNDPEQRLHAVTTALMMIEKTRSLSVELKERGFPVVNIGIGINTGTMNVGDMGSQYRRAYTVLGDAVNLGSRLESITKFYGANILVSESVLSGIADQLLYREVDYIQVKGKNEAIKVFEPLSFIGAASSEQKAFVKHFHDARQLFLQRDWQEAKRLFKELYNEDKSSSMLYTVYLERCAMYSSHPPAADWQGVWKHDSK